MKNRLIAAIILLIVLSTLGFAGCRGKPSEASQRQIAEVERGDLTVTITADGNLDLPEAMELYFDTTAFTPPYSGIITWESPDLKEGDLVREGTLLAKLDDTYQKKNVASAQYDVELAMNELVEKIHPALWATRKCILIPAPSSVWNKPKRKLGQVQKFLEQGKYQEAAAELRLAIHDLEASYEMFNVPEIAMALQGYNELLDNYSKTILTSLRQSSS